MTEAKKQDDGQEPTMEEILASIRQVISDDDQEDYQSEEVAETGDGAPDEVLEEDDVLELTEIVDNFAESFEGKSNSKQEFELEPKSSTADLSPITENQTLLSDHAAEVATDKLSGLTGAIAAARDLPVGNTQQTLEDIVKDLLRPILKEWLDDNLPPLVEGLVEKEIAKLVGRARGQ